MRKIFLIILPLSILLLVWFIITFFNFVNPLFLAPPGSVFSKLLNLITSGDVVPDIAATLFRLFIGFLIAIVIGVPIGLLIGYYEKIYVSVEFLIDFFRSLPATALFPLFLLFFGIGDYVKIVIVVFACSLVIIVNTVYGVRNTKKLRLIMAKTMKASNFKLFTKIIFPESFPHVFAGLRVALSIALIIVVVLEMFVGTTTGLGYRIIQAQIIYRVPELYALIIITGSIGYLINKGLMLIEKKFIHWSGR